MTHRVPAAVADAPTDDAPVDAARLGTIPQCSDPLGELRLQVDHDVLAASPLNGAVASVLPRHLDQNRGLLD